MVRIILCIALVAHSLLAFCQDDWHTLLAQSALYRQQGKIRQSLDLLTAAQRTASSPDALAQANGELGLTLYQAGRYAEAERASSAAYAYYAGPERARYALDLGNIAFALRQGEKARGLFDEATLLAGPDRVTSLSAQLNLARTLAPAPLLERLSALGPDIEALGDDPARPLLHLNLGAQAVALGQPGRKLAYRHLEQARRLSTRLGQDRLVIESLDSLAQLYETNGRSPEALELTARALDRIRTLPADQFVDLSVDLEWRRGRLLRGAGNDDQALAAYERAVSQLEKIRQDMPIDNEDGRSSFESILQPLYSEYADLLLSHLDQLPASRQDSRLSKALGAAELLRQAEMQDYLGDRCIVDAVRGEATTSGPATGSGILYPIVLDDRVELLLRTDKGITRRSVTVEGTVVREAMRQFALDLRQGRNDMVLVRQRAQQLYDWLLRPVRKEIADQKIGTIVVAADGSARMLPFGALHDGERYVIETLAVSTVTGMSMTNASAPRSVAEATALVSGMAEPGPVLHKLPAEAVSLFISDSVDLAQAEAAVATTRTVRGRRAAASVAPGERPDALREAMTLPRVEAEVRGLSETLHATTLLDQEFTKARFRGEAGSGKYRILHIASHGIFGGAAGNSYILAYDDYLTMDDLQDLLRADSLRSAPVDLLTLSACETADGNDRAPLGISGAAMKARARSVLGSLWRVEDEAAQTLMQTFYDSLRSQPISKAKALQAAQVKLLHSADFSHPFFWAPFVLIGNWQ